MTTSEHRGGADRASSRPVRPPDAVGPSPELDRSRIVAATMDVVSTVGFAQARVEDIVATAGVGRRKFWTHFSDKNAALVAGYEQITQALRDAVQAAHDHEPDPARRVTACLLAMAEFLAADPVRADVFLVQGPAAGREVIEIRTETMRLLGGLLASTVAEVAPCPGGAPDRTPIVVESLAGGLYEVAYARTFAGRVCDLPALVPDLARLVLTPYLGHDGAEASVTP